MKKQMTCAPKLGWICMAISLMLVGCSNQENGHLNSEASQALEAMTGCYTATAGTPAQIKITQSDEQWWMQMKEPPQANRVWDDPEPLEVIRTAEVARYFDINRQYVLGSLGRPDRLFVLTHIQPSYANLDPLLDSSYLTYIYKGANTIYRVDCDDAPVIYPTNPHDGLFIETVPSRQT